MQDQFQSTRPYLSTQKLHAEDRVEGSIVIPSLTAAVRCLGYLQEMGISATIDDSTLPITIMLDCLAKELDKANFALYLMYRWIDTNGEEI